MEQCLIDNKICSVQNQRCKECKFDSCKQAIRIVDTEQEKEYNNKLNRIRKQLPEQCKSCSFLEVVSIEKQKVYCPYMINKCILKEEQEC